MTYNFFLISVNFQTLKILFFCKTSKFVKNYKFSKQDFFPLSSSKTAESFGPTFGTNMHIAPADVLH